MLLPPNPASGSGSERGQGLQHGRWCVPEPHWGGPPKTPAVFPKVAMSLRSSFMSTAPRPLCFGPMWPCFHGIELRTQSTSRNVIQRTIPVEFVPLFRAMSHRPVSPTLYVAVSIRTQGERWILSSFQTRNNRFFLNNCFFFPL